MPSNLAGAVSIPNVHWRAQLDWLILSKLDSYDHPFGRYETFFPLGALIDGALTRDFARTALRSLTDRGLCQYRAGLMSEDGEFRGAGYGLTEAGDEHLKMLRVGFAALDHIKEQGELTHG